MEAVIPDDGFPVPNDIDPLRPRSGSGRVVERFERIELTSNRICSARGRESRIGFDPTMRIEVHVQPAGK